MKILEIRLVTLVLVLLATCYLVGVFLENIVLESYSKTWSIFVFVYFYFKHSRRKSLFFGGALLFFALSEVSKIYFNFLYKDFSVVTNVFFVTAYVFIISYIFNNINVKELVKTYWLQAVFLFIFSAYIVYSLNSFVFSDVKFEFFSLIYLQETIYNIVLLFLISLSLLNFLYHDDIRSLLIFSMSLLFGLGEIIQASYIFLSPQFYLKLMYSICYLLAYAIIYVYITRRYNKQFSIFNFK